MHIAHTELLKAHPLFSKSIFTLPPQHVHTWTSMNQVPQLAALQVVGQYSNYSCEKGISETPHFSLPGDSAECEQEWHSWEWQPLYAALAICKRRWETLCMQAKNNKYWFWLNNDLWQQRCHFCEIKISTGVTQPCIVLGPGVSKLKQDSNNWMNQRGEDVHALEQAPRFHVF